MRIRMAGLEDAAALLAIYAPYVRETAITFEYDVRVYFPGIHPDLPDALPGVSRIRWRSFRIWLRKTTAKSSAMRMRARSIRARPISGARR